MEDEVIYFDEEVKGHKLLITSREVIFKGSQFQTSLIDAISTVTHQSSTNGVPTAAVYIISMTCKTEPITVRCSGFAWFGRGQFERLRGVVHKSIGIRLIVQALGKLKAGEIIVFELKGHMLEKDSRLVLSRSGVNIDQAGIFGHKALSIKWNELRMKNINGQCNLSSYADGTKANFQLWHMSNNMVFSGVIGHLLDKANYRSLG
jgi:hypothetical protein